MSWAEWLYDRLCEALAVLLTASLVGGLAWLAGQLIRSI